MAVGNYLVFLGFGNRETLLKRIKHYVQEMNLGILLPLVKFEPKKRGEYYFGIAITEDGHDNGKPIEIILKACEYLNIHPIKNINNSYLFSVSEIRGFLTSGVQWESFNKPISFEEYKDEDGVHLILGDESEKHITNDQYNKIFSWILAKGNGTYDSLNHVCQNLLNEKQKPFTRSLIRNLMLLGHIESTYNRKKLEWSLAPLALVQSCKNRDLFYLRGHINRFNIESLIKEKAIAEEQPVEGPISFVIMSSNNVENIMQLSGAIEVGQVGNKLSAILPKIDDYKEVLTKNIDIQDYSYNFKKYNGKYFNDIDSTQLEPGLYQVKHREGEFNEQVVLYDDGKWFNGAFYDLRFLSLTNLGIEAQAYLNSDGDLLIHEISRWPFIYEKAIVLSSGELPLMQSTQDGDNIIMYKNIDTSMVEHLCAKLSVKLVKGEFNA